MTLLRTLTVSAFAITSFAAGGVHAANTPDAPITLDGSYNASHEAQKLGWYDVVDGVTTNKLVAALAYMQLNGWHEGAELLYCWMVNCTGGAPYPDFASGIVVGNTQYENAVSKIAGSVGLRGFNSGGGSWIHSSVGVTFPDGALWAAFRGATVEYWALPIRGRKVSSRCNLVDIYLYTRTADLYRFDYNDSFGLSNGNGDHLYFANGELYHYAQRRGLQEFETGTNWDYRKLQRTYCY